MKIKGIQPWRRLVKSLQAFLILGIPFLKIGGESALRFDIPTLRLHFFGTSLWMEEFFIVLAATIFLTLLIVFITLVFGRVWCGWLCPQTVLVDYTGFVDKSSKKGLLYKILSYGAAFLISIIVGANLIWYFICPYEFFERLFSCELGNVIRGFWIVLTGIIFLNLAFLRHKFCATVCPYAKMQSSIFDDKTLVIAFDPKRKDECINCMECVRMCPVGIDIRGGLNAACINCAECIDKCAKTMGLRRKGGLIGYSFGLPGETGRIIRQNVIMVGSITIIFLFFFIYLVFSRVSIGMTVLPNYDFSPRITNGSLVNSYLLSVKNMTSSDVKLGIKAAGLNRVIKTTPDAVMLKAGEIKKFPIFIVVEDFRNKKTEKDILILLESRELDKIKVIKKEATLIVPEV